MKAVKETERKYYKYQYNDWTQPTLTENGTMGGDSFAVSDSTGYAYYAWDGKSDTMLYLTTYGGIETFFYNPKPLKISTLSFTYYFGSYISSGEFYGSEDGVTYTRLTTFAHSGDGIVEVNNSTPYKYFKINVISAMGGMGMNEAIIKQIDITAQEKTIVEGTESDHDFYEEFNNYKLPSKVEAKYFKTLLEESTAGTYSLELPAGDYTIEMYGAGGGVSGNTYKGWHRIHGGGSGAGFKALVTLEAGTYNVTVGKGGTGRAVWNGAGTGDAGTPSTFGTLITCGAGTAGTGTGGVVTLSEQLVIKEVYKNKDGEGGGYADVYNSWAQLNSGYSTYDGTHYGYGAGGWWYGNGPGTDTQNGLDGYCKIVGQITDDIERKYYKYTEWTQPVLTSNTSSPIMSVSASNEGQGEAWKAFDGDNSTHWATANNVTSASLTVDFTKDIYVKAITVQGLQNQYGSTNTITIYSDTSKQNIVGQEQTFNYSNSNTLTWTFSEPVKVDTLVFYGTGTTWVAVLDIKITAKQGLEGTESDHDFYEEVYKKYYKYSDWTQPVLTADGVMGGDSFALAQSSSFNGQDFWKLFSDNPEDWHSAAGLPQWVSWYNPKPLKVTKLYFAEQSSGQIGNFIIQACDDNSSWIDILSYSNTSSTSAFEVDLSSNSKAYKYWRIYITSCYYSYNGSYYPLIGKGFTITGKEVIESTESDYDFYEEHRPTMKQEIITCYGIGE